MFGLELRKKDSPMKMSTIYDNVDKILSESGINKDCVSFDVQSQAIAHSLHKMLKSDSYFCICTIRNCIELSNLVISKERMNLYQTQHCVHWNEMTEDFRTKLVAMILDDFRSILNPTDVTGY